MFIPLVQTPDGRWEPGIGDPTFAGWFTVFAYFVAAYFCYDAHRKTRKRGPSARRLTLAWGLLAVGMASIFALTSKAER